MDLYLLLVKMYIICKSPCHHMKELILINFHISIKRMHKNKNLEPITNFVYCL